MQISRVLGGVAVAVFLPGNAIAGALEDCVTAYDRQDYAAALQLCRPFAEQGDARAQRHHMRAPGLIDLNVRPRNAFHPRSAERNRNNVGKSVTPSLTEAKPPMLWS
jgi:hypothetical protein